MASPSEAPSTESRQTLAILLAFIIYHYRFSEVTKFSTLFWGCKHKNILEILFVGFSPRPPVAEGEKNLRVNKPPLDKENFQVVRK